jgi:hypothetical protein
MSEKEADAARVAEIQRLLAVVPEVVQGTWVWNEAAAAGLTLLPGLVAWLLADRERQAAELERLRAQITAVLYQIEVARSENRLAHWQAWELAQTVERLLAGNAAAETGEPE